MFKVGKYAGVFSNHFEYGRSSYKSRRFKYIKGYDTDLED